MNLEDSDASASAWLQEQLIRPSNPELSKLLTEIELTRLRGQPLRQLPSFQAALFQSVLQQRQTAYNAAVRADWSKVCVRYEQNGEFYFNLPNCRVYPVALDPITEQPDPRFATKPATDLAVAISYDIVEEKSAQETQEQLNRDNPYSTWTIGHLRRTRWSLNIYGGVPEQIYAGFAGTVHGWMEDFKRKHGGSVTPVIVVPQSRVLLHVGADQIFVGFRIEQKNSENEEPSKPKKGGLLDKLTNLL